MDTIRETPEKPPNPDVSLPVKAIRVHQDGKNGFEMYVSPRDLKMILSLYPDIIIG